MYNNKLNKILIITRYIQIRSFCDVIFLTPRDIYQHAVQDGIKFNIIQLYTPPNMTILFTILCHREQDELPFTYYVYTPGYLHRPYLLFIYKNGPQQLPLIGKVFNYHEHLK